MDQNKTPNKADNATLAARKVAAYAIEQVVIKKRPLDGFFARDAGFLDLSAQDRAFCQRLVRSTLRHLGELEASFANYFKRPIAKDKYIVLAHIYLAAGQMAYAEIPPYAAIDSAVELVKQAQPKFAQLVNATLRRWLREYKDGLSAQPTLNLPDWLCDRWWDSYDESVSNIAYGLAQEPPLDLSFKNTEARGRFLHALGAEAQRIGDSVRVFKRSAVSELPEYEAGNWWVQDLAASLPVTLFGNVRGKKVLDMCAAPGGKAMQLAALGADVLALDSQEKRLEVMQENTKRTGLLIEMRCENAMNLQGEATFDAILLDAPCSATGTIRRNPDVKYLRNANNLLDSVSKQKKLLGKALYLLKPGGKLVYCVCSMEKEEGEDVIQALLNEEKGAILANDSRMLPIEVLDSGGLGYRTHPGMLPEHGGMDGFFMTCLEKR